MEILNDRAWIDGILIGPFGIMVRDNMSTAPTPLAQSKKAWVRPSPAAWESGNLSTDPSRPNEAIVSGMGNYWQRLVYGSTLNVTAGGQLYGGQGGEKNSFWVSKAYPVSHSDGMHAVWHVAIGGWDAWSSSYRNSLMSFPVTWANFAQYPRMADDGTYVGLTSDNVEPTVAYMTSDFGGGIGVCMNIWDGSQMRFSPANLLVIDRGGYATARRYSPQVAPAKKGGVWVLWASGGNTMLRYVSSTGSMGTPIVVGAGAPGAICTDSKGNVHVTYSGSTQMYAKVLVSGSSEATRPCDFNGDGKVDRIVFDPISGHWWTYAAGVPNPITWGFAGVIPVPGDYSGDGKDDPGVYDPVTGNWWVYAAGFPNPLNWGYAGVVPVPADYNGDGKVDPAVYDPITGNWWVHAAGFPNPVNWGFTGVIPVPGDYNGDGKEEPAVYDPVTGNWWIHAAGFPNPVNWGFPGAVPVAGDYNGDGKVDPAVYDPITGNWWVYAAGFSNPLSWGFAGVSAVPGDYNGDGKTEPAVYDPVTGNWWIHAAGVANPVAWGFAGVIPIGGQN